MIKLLTYHDIDQQQWRELIQSSPVATWFQTKEAYEFYAALSSEEMTPFAVGVLASPKSSPKGKDFYEPTPNPFNQPLLNPSLIKSYPQPLPKRRVALRLEIKAGNRLFLWNFYNKNTALWALYK